MAWLNIGLLLTDKEYTIFCDIQYFEIIVRMMTNNIIPGYIKFLEIS